MHISYHVDASHFGATPRFSRTGGTTYDFSQIAAKVLLHFTCYQGVHHEKVQPSNTVGRDCWTRGHAGRVVRKSSECMSGHGGAELLSGDQRPGSFHQWGIGITCVASLGACLLNTN